ncbi:MAG: hypothetical protein ACX93P_01130 [Roseovarius sp.]
MRDTRDRANRENARRSTGPRSPKGKRRAAQNAQRHGVMSHAARTARRERLLAEMALPEIAPLAHLSASDPDVIRLVDAVARLQLVHEAETALDASFAAQLAQMCGGDNDPAADCDPVDTLLGESRLLARYRAEAASARRRALRVIIDRHQTTDEAQNDP